MERRRALLGQMHTVCSVWGHSWRGSGIPEIPAEQPSRLSQCQAVLWSPGWGRDKAANSTRGSQFLLGQAWLLLYREIFKEHFGSTQALSVKTQGVCLKSLLTSREWRLQHCTEGSNKPLLRLSSNFTGALHAEYSQIPFSLQETQEGWHSKPKQS